MKNQQGHDTLRACDALDIARDAQGQGAQKHLQTRSISRLKASKQEVGSNETSSLSIWSMNGVFKMLKDI